MVGIRAGLLVVLAAFSVGPTGFWSSSRTHGNEFSSAKPNVERWPLGAAAFRLILLSADEISFQNSSIWGLVIISQNMVMTAMKAGTPNAHHCQSIR
jgi:hypothetical protein